MDTLKNGMVSWRNIFVKNVDKKVKNFLRIYDFAMILYNCEVTCTICFVCFNCIHMFLYLLRSLFGNIFTFIKFEGKRKIDADTRHQVIWVLGAIAAASIIAFLTLREPKSNPKKELHSSRGFLFELKKTWSIFITKEMLILSITFCFTGK